MHPLACVTVNGWPPIVRAPDRASPVLAAAVQFTVPLPLPLLPEVTVNHGALLEAVQAHPVPAVTLTLPVPPPACALPLGGAIENVHAPVWFTVKVWPPIVSVPDRAAPEVDATVYCTVPLPLPVAPDVTVSHGTLLVVVHAHPAPAVTVTLPVAPPAGALALDGAMDTVQALA